MLSGFHVNRLFVLVVQRGMIWVDGAEQYGSEGFYRFVTAE